MKPKVVLDTNVLLVSISSRSSLYWVFEQLMEENYSLCVTTDILDEYAEIIEQHMGTKARDNALGVLENLPNVIQVIKHFRFELLQDPDDNKFVDCAVASNANFIVSHDTDFKPLKDVPFPKVVVLDTEQFKKMLKEV